LDEIGSIISNSNVHGMAGTSRERARNFYDPLDLPQKLKSYIADSRKDSMSAAARMFGISAGTLKKIIEGGVLPRTCFFAYETHSNMPYSVPVFQ